MKFISFDEPWPGLTDKGIEVTCNRQVTISAEQAIKVQRHACSKHKKKKKLTDDELLTEFMVVNWAYWAYWEK